MGVPVEDRRHPYKVPKQIGVIFIDFQLKQRSPTKGSNGR